MAFNSVNRPISVNSERSYCVIGQRVKAMDDELLISAARLGDANAFSELYERHSRKVLPRVYRITKNREDAEDVLQDAALRAFLHIKGFEGRASFSTWLTTIATNSALMILRKKRGGEISIDQTSDDNSRPWEYSDGAETPEARYAGCERDALLTGAIRRLPYIYREILELQRSDEYSTAQIAEQLGISPSAAKSRLMRARKTLRRAFQVRIQSRVNSRGKHQHRNPFGV